MRKRLLLHERQRRLTGQTFLTKAGSIHRSKSLQPSCTSNCRRKCYTKITDEQRQVMFDEYYGLADLHLQWQYLARHLKKDIPKYHFIKEKYRARVEEERQPINRVRNRSNNIHYYLNINNEMIRVCKAMFCATFDITVAVVDSAIRKTNERGQLVQGDNRGRRSENQMKKGLELLAKLNETPNEYEDSSS